jgi:acyl carrier protein
VERDYRTIRAIVIDALHAVRAEGPGILIGDDARPIGDLGLASADGIDFTLELEDRLKCRIDDRVNPLVSDDGHRARTVKEIIEWIATSESLRLENSANA